jgi:hypothetical protein
LGNNNMKQIIILISLIASIAFLVMSIVATWQIFTILLDTDSVVRAELWIFLIMSFTGGVILLSMSWGIAELGDRNRMRPAMAGDDDDDI